MRLRAALVTVRFWLWLGLFWLGPVVRAHGAEPSADEPRWCAPELSVVGESVCHFAPRTGERSTKDHTTGDRATRDRPTRKPETLVIFLHGVIQPGTEWQWAQQRGIARAARELGFEALMPRGRRGIGPRGMEDWWTWPTSTRAQRAVEDELVKEWQEARRHVEAERGEAFRALIVVGFSNGAYYASSLALRGRLQAVGYGIFAGGGAQYLEKTAKKTAFRPPIYVGYGARDRVGMRDARAFSEVLRRLRWPHQLVGRPSVGHSMTDAQLREAIEFIASKPNR